MQSSKYRNQLVLLIAAVLFGFNPTVIKLGITEMPGWIFNFFRMGVASIVLVIILIKSRTHKRVRKKHIKYFIALALASFCLQTGYINGMRYCSSALASTILGLTPVSVLLINRVVKKKIATRNNIIGVIITVIGIALISRIYDGNAVFEGQVVIGIMFMLLTQFSHGVITIISEHLSPYYSKNQITAYLFLSTFVLVIFMAIPQFRGYSVSQIDLTGWLCILYGGIVSLSLANTLYVWGISLCGSNIAGIYNNLSPIFATLSGALILNEIPDSLQLLGVFIAITGFIIFQSNKEESLVFN